MGSDTNSSYQQIVSELMLVSENWPYGEKPTHLVTTSETVLRVETRVFPFHSPREEYKVKTLFCTCRQSVLILGSESRVSDTYKYSMNSC